MSEKQQEELDTMRCEDTGGLQPQGGHLGFLTHRLPQMHPKPGSTCTDLGFPKTVTAYLYDPNQNDYFQTLPKEEREVKLLHVHVGCPSLSDPLPEKDGQIQACLTFRSLISCPSNRPMTLFRGIITLIP